ncbi:hypothetical protein [Fimbriimonas ginsengisoli]|uniref:Uncharacterized protein n=1 Tax=Fimbriimonas ginsengisoli Gsoil 348 TaxID=661478 RepID=A0A068NYV3_FIMGI|nr:hypothetical protein [Fimbriimonas ginsengisoli]AIE87474.1 hypothetical protein OP10G_4106 [Fimbriimonas ginsengisoli Gsoil 348]
MKNPRRALLFSGAVALLAATGYCALRPTWRRATRAEVDRILGPELVRPVTIDPVKKARFNRAVAIIGSLRLSMFPTDVVTHLHNIQEDARVFWDTNPVQLGRLSAVIDEGPWQCTPDIGRGIDPKEPVNRLIQSLPFAVLGSTKPADRNRFKYLASLACRFSRRLVESATTPTDYEIFAQGRQDVDCAIAESIESSRLDAGTLRNLLDQLDKPLPDRTVIREVVREEFRDTFYDYLPDPRASKAWQSGIPRVPGVAENAPFLCGNYSATDTATEMNLLYSKMMENVSGDYRRFDPRAEAKVRQLASAVDEFPCPAEDTLEAFEFKFKMNRIDNSFGRYLLGSHLSSDQLLAARMLSETTHELVRGELSLALYSRQFGHLPEDLSDLVHSKVIDRPLVDPYSGEPLHYDPKRRRLWSVGGNMTDERGTGKKFRDQLEQDLICPIP